MTAVPTPSPAPAPPTATTRIHDRGYRGYDGPRTGRRGAIATLYRFTLARVLGMRRPFRAKALPIMVGVIAYLPAIVLLGLTVLLPQLDDDALPGYADYYGFVIAAIVVFVSFVAPEAICPDRRHRMLGTYLASPLDRRTYPLVKLSAVVTLISMVTLLPPLLLAVARTIQGIGPAPGDLAVLIARIVASGAVLAVVFGAVSLGVSSLTDRKAFASAGMILLVIVTSTIGAVLAGPDGDDSGFLMVNVSLAPLELVLRIHGSSSGAAGVPLWTVIASCVTWTALGLGTLFWRYATLEVTR
jgi:ABC-2 type transport system permease protein